MAKAALKKLADFSDKTLYQRPNLNPMMYIAKMAQLDFGVKGMFTVAIHGGYNAMGLIGTEANGLCILQDGPNPRVVLDRHQCTESGMDTPTKQQLSTFDEIVASDWAVFRDFINNHERSRVKYD